MRAILNMYATPVAGFECSIGIWSNVEEAYASIGQKLEFALIIFFFPVLRRKLFLKKGES